MSSAFWILFGLVLYCYFGYPLLLMILAKFFEQKIDRNNIEPTVSVVLSVYNEDDVIAQKIGNLLALDYPADKMEILIGSDGSDDNTNDIIADFKDTRVKHFIQNSRRGKMATINELATNATGDIIVFTDARQMFERSAIRILAQNFADSRVGCVSGGLVFGGHSGATAQGISLYWNYEKFLRKKESQLHSMIGATGAIYAIRWELFEPAPEHTILDDVYIPLGIVQQGYRAIFDERAKAYDQVADSPREEYRRKVRTLYGNYQIFGMMPQIFNPFRSPLALQIFSHKLLRVLIPFILIALLLVNTVLATDILFQKILTLQVAFYGLAILGFLLRYEKNGIFRIVSKICYVPYVFCLLNFSAFMGFLRFVGEKQDVAWSKARVKKSAGVLTLEKRATR